MSSFIDSLKNGGKIVWEHREEILETGRKVWDFIKDISDDGKRNYSTGKK